MRSIIFKLFEGVWLGLAIIPCCALLRTTYIIMCLHYYCLDIPVPVCSSMHGDVHCTLGIALKINTQVPILIFATKLSNRVPPAFPQQHISSFEKITTGIIIQLQRVFLLVLHQVFRKEASLHLHMNPPPPPPAILNKPYSQVTASLPLIL